MHDDYDNDKRNQQWYNQLTSSRTIYIGVSICINICIYMEDKVKNLGVIFDSRLSFEDRIKPLCSSLNGTLSIYLHSFKNTLDQKSNIILVNALIFSHLSFYSLISGKCSEKLQYEVQKCINFDAKEACNGKYLKVDMD